MKVGFIHYPDNISSQEDLVKKLEVDAAKVVVEGALPSEVEECLVLYARGLTAMRNFGTHVVTWLTAEEKGKRDHGPAILLFRHLLVYLDSVAIQVREGQVEACALSVRGIFESAVGLKYMCTKQIGERALAYKVAYYHRELQVARRHSENTPEGKSFRMRMEAAGFSLSGMQTGGEDEYIEWIERFLAEPANKPVHDEFVAKKKRLRNDPPWYSLFSGPTTLKKLATLLGMELQFEELYGEWSAAAHGADVISGRLVMTDEGKGKMAPIRYPVKAQSVTSMAMLFTMEALHAVSTLIPSRLDKFQEWFHFFEPYYREARRNPLFEFEGLLESAT